jgi:hypothetical protein
MRLDVTKPPQATKNSTMAALYLLQAEPAPRGPGTGRW